MLLLKALQWLITAFRIKFQPPYQGKQVPPHSSHLQIILISALLYLIFEIKLFAPAILYPCSSLNRECSLSFPGLCACYPQSLLSIFPILL